MSQKIYIACDHAGFELKQYLIEKFSASNINFIDLGCDNSQDSVDYPDYAKKLSQEISENDLGILICGSGIGISIAANRFKHIRAALCHNEESAQLSRRHNNANVLALGARLIDSEDAIKITESFLNTEFEAGRHSKRVEKLSA